MTLVKRRKKKVILKTNFHLKSSFTTVLESIHVTYTCHCFRVTSLISTFITLERCLCIILPIKVKVFITPTKTKIIITLIFSFTLVIFVPFYLVNRLEWQHYQGLNKTLLTLVYTSHKIAVETATFPIYGVAIPVATLLIIILCTIILVIQLNKKAEWRKKTTVNNKSATESTSLKDKKVVKMVTLISVIFIICYTPAAILFLVMTCEPQFSFTGKHENLFYVLWSVTMFSETVSSSVNIFVYYTMSSKFKKTLQQKLWFCFEN